MVLMEVLRSATKFNMQVNMLKHFALLSLL